MSKQKCSSTATGSTRQFIVLLACCMIVILSVILWSRCWLQTISVYTNVVNDSVLTSEERDILLSVGHLFLLPVDELWKNEIWFASFDIPIMMKSGRIKVFPMEQSPSNDFVKFYIHNEVRAVHGLRLTMTIYGGVEVSLPYDNEKFLWSWNNGRFLDCLGMSIPYEITESVIPKRFVKSMSQFRDLVESYGSHLFLFGGTLLGWYRECAFIRDTKDVDFAMQINELNETMLEDLQKNTSLKLYWILGKANDSLELSVYSDSIKMDLFFVFHDEEYDWVGGMIVYKKQKLRWIYPRIDKLCVGDLYGHLFHVPCNVEQVLEADYGKNWTERHKNDEFLWYSSHKNVQKTGKWTKQEWNDVYRIFE